MFKRLLYPALAIAVFIGLWWAVAAYFDSQLLPTPWQTARAAIDISKLAKNWYQVSITTYRVLVGAMLGSVAGTAMGIATRYSRIAETAVKSVIHPVLQAVPPICWAIVFVLWFGLGNGAPIMTVAVAVAPYFTINIWEGMKELDANLVEMAATYTRKRFRVLAKVIMPMLYPYIFAAVRSSFMTAWKIVVLGEIFGSASGIGYMIWNDFQIFRIASVFAWTLTFAIILITFDYGLFNYIDRKYMRRWKPKEAKP